MTTISKVEVLEFGGDCIVELVGARIENADECFVLALELQVEGLSEELHLLLIAVKDGEGVGHRGFEFAILYNEASLTMSCIDN